MDELDRMLGKFGPLTPEQEADLNEFYKWSLKMSEPNIRQVGGNHYNSKYQHWDWCIKVKLGYLEGNATRYLVRYNKKGTPVDDLLKALSYIDKLLENAHICVAPRLPGEWVQQELELFCEENSVPQAVAHVMFTLATWGSLIDLRHARNIVAGLLGSLPTPRDDSNKHAQFDPDVEYSAQERKE